MSKVKTLWVCEECGHSQPKWSGKCGKCGQWNTFHEEQSFEEVSRFAMKPLSVAQAVPLKQVTSQDFPRLSIGMKEVGRILGGGVVSGSLTLVGGDPGIGKSTLMMQISRELAKGNRKVLYVCGEESIRQTSLRAKRLGIEEESIYLLNETSFSAIKAQIEAIRPEILVIDSIQIVYKNEIPSLPGSVVQIKEVAMECMHLAKGLGITIFLIGHVTKSGDLAGPRVLEHIVDTVLEFEGDAQHGYRLLRSVKNRFGSTDEVAVFQMLENGLKEVENPSEIFLSERIKNVAGSAIIPTLEGSRSILIEAQALVAPSPFSNSTRRSTGIDQNRLALLLAVLEKRVGYHFHQMDVFASIAGGMKIFEPAIDLGVLLAVASSFTSKAIDPETVVIGEVGLAGEVRSVSRIESRLKESIHMGFKRCILPKKVLKTLDPSFQKKIKLLPVDLVEQAIEVAFV